ncbi:MAG: undecaprenyldiphospho-muramoylpentapeptide beta-N-acetylglucosaminyltransferase [Candidatus Portnoybacteria bacterium]|nr:undecaprenyldiphospho-muramoylpentapeptide beta-N-acetylglucosaminyltransferase [Candidatus Portnoybacteria bacterium]
MRILFTGGGTGGHLFPLVAVARQLKSIYPQNEGDLEMFFLGPDDFSKNILEKEGIKTKTILAGKVRRYFSIKNVIDLFKMPFGFLQTFWYLYLWMPEVIFSKGGYGSVPVVLVAWLYRIPVLIHESDTIPGLANRLAVKFSEKIAISFTSAGKYFPAQKTALVGNPIRQEIIQACASTNPEEKEKAKNVFNINSQKSIILVLGGSQGAEKINDLISSTLSTLLEKYEIIHQCGFKNFEQIKEKTGQLNGYHLYPFLDDQQIAAAYTLANLIISRAGAGSISEIAVCRKPSILIPLPDAAADHQRENAFAYARAGATTVLEQDNLTSHMLLNEISKILGNPALIQKISANAENFSQPEAAQRIAQALIEMGK